MPFFPRYSGLRVLIMRDGASGMADFPGAQRG